MTERHVIVYHRDSAWQYTFRGSVAGPFGSREETIEAAIAEARDSGDEAVEVVVQNPDMRQETVWRRRDGSNLAP